MSEVSYSNVPPMMAAIKSGDIEAISGNDWRLAAG